MPEFKEDFFTTFEMKCTHCNYWKIHQILSSTSTRLEASFYLYLWLAKLWYSMLCWWAIIIAWIWAGICMENQSYSNAQYSKHVTQKMFKSRTWWRWWNLFEMWSHYSTMQIYFEQWYMLNIWNKNEIGLLKNLAVNHFK